MEEEIKKPYSLGLLILVFVVGVIVTPIIILSNNSFSSSNEKPGYEIISKKNLGLEDLARIQVDAITKITLQSGELQKISESIVGEIISKEGVNAIAIRFWEHRDAIENKIAFATVVWAPYGEWSRALDVTQGNYSTHDYTLNVLRTVSYG